MRTRIPNALLALCAKITANRETHRGLDNLFRDAGAPGEPPDGNKPDKALAWLRRVNSDETIEPLVILGRIIETYMEETLIPNDEFYREKTNDRERIEQALEDAQLRYIKGGRITGAVATPSRALEQFIRDRDLGMIDSEFERALTNVESSPREAVSAASNILESVCKVYIADEALEMPAKQDLQPVWNTVRKHLGFDPSAVEDEDLKKILSGLLSTVDGIGALRSHASSAHGAGKKHYRLQARHARLAVHAAHTVALFVLESWDKKKQALS